MISRLQSYDIIPKVVSVSYGKHASIMKKETITNQWIMKSRLLRPMENFGTVLIPPTILASRRSLRRFRLPAAHQSVHTQKYTKGTVLFVYLLAQEALTIINRNFSPLVAGVSGIFRIFALRIQ